MYKQQIRISKGYNLFCYDLWKEPTEEQKKQMESLGAKIEQSSGGEIIWVVN